MQRTLISPFIVLTAWIGAGYTVGDPRRTAGRSFEAAKEIAPMDTWGVLFLVIAAAMAAAWILYRREALAAALLLGGALYVWWACLFAIAALTDPRASVVGPGLYLFVAFMHFVATWRIWVFHR